MPKPRYSKLQEVTYHESSHAVIAIRVGLPVDFVELLTPDASEFSQVHGQTGFRTMEPRYPDLLRIIRVGMAGPVAHKIMFPHKSYREIMFRAGFGDECKVGECIREYLHTDTYGADYKKLYRELLADTTLRVKLDWHTILRLGDLLAVQRRIEGAEIIKIVGESDAVP